MNLDTIPASTDGPAQDPQPRHRPAALAPASAFYAGPINILIVDDEPKNLTVLETVLDDPGYRLVRAESADQALLALVEDEFALLILDIQMPGMTGFELAQLIKERKKTAQVPIIFLTAYYNEDQHMLEGYGTGAVDYLVKPVNPAILRSKVAVFAELHRKSRALLAEVIERRRAEEQLRELNESLEQRVTERTAALMMTSTALSETGERYRSLFDSSLDAIFSLGPDERFAAANPAALRLTARTLEELKTIRFLDLCAPDQREAAENAFRAILGRQSLALDTTVITATGERRDLFISGTPAIVDGTVVGVSCIASDITERKRAQETVRQSEARLNGIISSALDAIITIDEAQLVTDFNNSAERMFGCAAADAVGQPIDRFIPKRSWAMQGDYIEAFGNTDVARRQMGAAGTIYGYRANGEDFPIEASISQLQTQAGKFYTVILRDMTERVRQEEALRRSERDLSDFFDNASIGLHWVGPDGIIIRVNQTELDLLGYSRDEYVGHHIGEFHVDEHVIQDILERLASGETLREYPAKIRCKDGSVLEVLINSNVLFDDGKFIHTRCFTRDVTDRKRAEEALQENEERFRTLADNMSQFAWTADPTGWIFWYNRRWYEYTGTTFEEMQGWGWEKVHHPEHLDRVVKKWRHAHVTGEPWEDTFPMRGLDGTYRWFLSRALPIRNAEGRIVRWFGTNTDITELRETQASLLESEERLKRQTSALADSNKELEGFSYSVSHDLRAPLRTIDAFSRILEEEHGPHLNAEANRCLTIVRKATAQAGELIDDLLEFSRLGRQGMSFSLVKMANLAREVADDLRIMREGRQIDLTIGDLPSCEGDRRFLKHVWVNLLTNAFKYTKNRNESRVEVGWMPDEASAEAVTYYVKDDGVGFDMKYVHKLFGVFQRLHRKEDFDGTGVGLAIVQRIVLRHGGRVWAEGKVDGGATFFFSLRKARA